MFREILYIIFPFSIVDLLKKIFKVGFGVCLSRVASEFTHCLFIKLCDKVQSEKVVVVCLMYHRYH